MATEIDLGNVETLDLSASEEIAALYVLTLRAVPVLAVSAELSALCAAETL